MWQCMLLLLVVSCITMPTGKQNCKKWIGSSPKKTPTKSTSFSKQVVPDTLSCVCATSDYAWLHTQESIPGMPISVSLFLLAINMIIKSAGVECTGPLSRSGIRQPPIRIMDDLTVMTTPVPGCRWLLQELGRLITRARMSFKPAKSRSLVLKKGRAVDHFPSALDGTQIPTVTEKPGQNLWQLPEWHSYTTANQETWPPGSRPLINQDSQENLKPGCTNMESCQGYSGRSWYTRYQWQRWRL